MTARELDRIQFLLREETRLDRGLTADERESIERTFGFRFPPDLAALLERVLPIGERFPDWRNDSHEDLADYLALPLEGLLFDVENNVFWLPEWGPKPAALEEAKSIATRHVREAPVLIPIYSHRFIPAEPAQAGNPVLSVHQTDIIYYGSNLSSYIEAEFGSNRDRPHGDGRPVRFWSRIIDLDL